MTIEPGPNKKKQGFHQLCFAFCYIDCAMILSDYAQVLKRGTGSGTWTGTPLQRVSRGEAQFLRVLRGSADEEQ